MSGFLDTVRAALHEQRSRTTRSQQVELGASDTYTCRAYAVMQLNEVPISDPRVSLPAEVGDGLHRILASAFEALGWQVEERVCYRGVWATADAASKEEEVVVDWKTKGDRGDVIAIRRTGPPPEHKAQVNVGAAGRIAAGFPVRTVRLVYIPRDGDLDDAYVWEDDFDQAEADAAVDWHDAISDLAVERAGLEPDEQAQGLRDQGYWWCAQFCRRFSVCRQSVEDSTPPVELDDAGLAAADEWLIGREMEEEGKSRRKAAAPLLGCYDNRALKTVGLRRQNNPSSGPRLDMKEIRANYEPLFGALPVLPPVEGESGWHLRRNGSGS